MTEREEAFRRLRAQAANGRASAHVFVKDLNLVLGGPQSPTLGPELPTGRIQPRPLMGSQWTDREAWVWTMGSDGLLRSSKSLFAAPKEAVETYRGPLTPVVVKNDTTDRTNLVPEPLPEGIEAGAAAMAALGWYDTSEVDRSKAQSTPVAPKERIVSELRRRATLPEGAPDRAFMVGIRYLLTQAADLIDVPEEEREPVAEIDAAREALKGYEDTYGTFQSPNAVPVPANRLYEALHDLLDLVDGAQLPIYDQRDMAKAYREGAYAMSDEWRRTEPGWPHNPYTSTGEFKDG